MDAIDRLTDGYFADALSAAAKASRAVSIAGLPARLCDVLGKGRFGILRSAGRVASSR